MALVRPRPHKNRYFVLVWNKKCHLNWGENPIFCHWTRKSRACVGMVAGHSQGTDTIANTLSLLLLSFVQNNYFGHCWMFSNSKCIYMQRPCYTKCKCPFCFSISLMLDVTRTKRHCVAYVKRTIKFYLQHLEHMRKHFAVAMKIKGNRIQRLRTVLYCLGRFQFTCVLLYTKYVSVWVCFFFRFLVLMPCGEQFHGTHNSRATNPIRQLKIEPSHKINRIYNNLPLRPVGGWLFIFNAHQHNFTYTLVV